MLPGLRLSLKVRPWERQLGADEEYKLEIPGDSEQVLIFSFRRDEDSRNCRRFEDAASCEVSRGFGNIG